MISRKKGQSYKWPVCKLVEIAESALLSQRIGQRKMKDTPQLRTSIVPIVGGFSCRYGSMPRFLNEFGVRLALLVSTLNCDTRPEVFDSSPGTDQ